MYKKMSTLELYVDKAIFRICNECIMLIDIDGSLWLFDIECRNSMAF